MPLEGTQGHENRIDLPFYLALGQPNAGFCDKRLVFTPGHTYIGYPVKQF